MDLDRLDLPTLVSLAGGGLVDHMLEHLANEGHPGVKPSHGYVMQRLVDDEPTVTGLARSLGMTQQGASKQVLDLERLGYVERVAGAGDQRTRRIRLTPAGKAMIADARRLRADVESAVVDAAGEQAVASAKAVLVAMLELTGLAERVRNRTVPAPVD